METPNFTANLGKKPAQNIDGFTSGARHSALDVPTPASHMSNIKHEPAKHQKRAPQRSQTLMRTAVKKPGSVNAPHAPIVAHRPPVMPPKVPVDRNPMVARFSPNQTSNPSFQDIKPQSAAHLISEVRIADDRPLIDSIIDEKLENATAHTGKTITIEKPTKAAKVATKRRKLLKFSGIGVGALVVVAAIIYLNLAGISVMLSSRKAGFSVALPNFTPASFRLDRKISAETGRAVMTFHSHNSDNMYTVIQEKTDISPDSLQLTVAAASNNHFQTLHSGGLTIYFTNQNTATWITNGILYSVAGNSGLSGEQITSIATSM